jgi:hypoxanthine phosphoribosyltransferase
MEQKTYLSWDEFDDLVQELHKVIERDGFVPDVIIGVARGGLVPLAIIAELIGTKNVAVVSARSYDGMDRGKLSVTAWPDLDLRGKRILLIDEITDTGETFRQLAALVQERYEPAVIKTAVVTVNTAHCKYMPDYSVMQTDVWVVFPWQEWPRRKREER